MADEPDRDQKTEEPTEKRKREAVEKGDVLQSRELGTAMIIMGGAAWIAMAGPWMMACLQDMLRNALNFDISSVEDFDPVRAAFDNISAIMFPVIVLFAITLVAAIGTPAILGSLGFRWDSITFKANRLDPMKGVKKIFGIQGIIELGKSIVKVLVLGAIGVWVLYDQSSSIMTLGRGDIVHGLAQLGDVFVMAVLVMGLGLALIAGIDVPAQMFQRAGRLRMSKQEVRDEAKEAQGSPETKAAQRRRAHEILGGSARTAIAEASVVLTNPTHFAVALRYKPGFDAAPIVVARGRGATAEAIRELASENNVQILSYPQLTRAIYYTTRAGQVIQEDLYVAVATILAFVFNIDTALARGIKQPEIDVPSEMRFDEDGRKAN